MANQQLVLGRDEDFFFLTSQGPDGTGLPSAVAIKVDDYSKAYVATPDGGHTIHVVPKALGTATVTVTGHSADGTAIPAMTRSYDIVAPPVPQATVFVFSPDNVAAVTNAPPDPGTDTVVGTAD